MEEGNTQAHRQQGDLINLLLFFQNKRSRLKIHNSEINNLQLDRINRITGVSVFIHHWTSD
jgi:hypothetical protein